MVKKLPWIDFRGNFFVNGMEVFTADQYISAAYSHLGASFWLKRQMGVENPRENIKEICANNGA